MKRLRLLVVFTVVTASLGLAAPPASATPSCDPDTPCPCDDPVLTLPRRVLGEPPCP